MSADPVQSLLLRRMCRDKAPLFGMPVCSREEAEHWAEKGIAPARGQRRC